MTNFSNIHLPAQIKLSVEFSGRINSILLLAPVADRYHFHCLNWPAIAFVQAEMTRFSDCVCVCVCVFVCALWSLSNISVSVITQIGSILGAPGLGVSVCVCVATASFSLSCPIKANQMRSAKQLLVPLTTTFQLIFAYTLLQIIGRTSPSYTAFFVELLSQRQHLHTGIPSLSTTINSD